MPLSPYNTPDRTNGVQAMVVTQLEHFSEQAGQLYENGELEHYVFSSKEFVCGCAYHTGAGCSKQGYHKPMVKTYRNLIRFYGN